MEGKVWAIGVVYAVLFSGLVLSEKLAELDETVNNMEEHVIPDVSTDNITEELEELKSNADGVDIFLAAVEKVIVDGGETVKIPAEIDPEQHNISLNDALDRTKDFLLEQNNEAKDLLSKVYEVLQEGNHVDSALLKKTGEEIIEILKNFAEAEQDVADYRRVISADQMYNYYYDSSEGDEYDDQEDDAEKEEEDEISKFEDSVEDVTEGDNKTDSSDGEEEYDDDNEENLIWKLEYDSDGDEVDDVDSKEDGEMSFGNDQNRRTNPESQSEITSTTAAAVPQDEYSIQNGHGEYVETESVLNTVSTVVMDETETTTTAKLPAPERDIYEEQQFNAILVEQTDLIEEKEDESISEHETNIEIEETDLIIKGPDDSPDNNSSILEQYQAILVEDELEVKLDDVETDQSRPSYGNDAIDPSKVVTDQDLYDTKVEWEQNEDELETEWYEPVRETYVIEDETRHKGNHPFFTFPTTIFVAIASPLAIILIAMLVCGVHRHRKYHRSITVKSRPLSDAHKDARVSVISICDSDVKKTYPPPVSANLPSYLEVISE